MTLITAPGIYYDIPEAAYHQDPTPEPSLSASMIDILLERSPAHAFAQHPRMTPQEPEEFKFNMGSLIHAMLLGGTNGPGLIEADSYRTARAQLAREVALATGLYPALTHQYAEADKIVDAIREQFDKHPLLQGVLDPGVVREVTVAWQEDSGPWCRCRPDLLLERRVVDLKITGIPATPEAWGSMHAMRMGYHRRSAWYRRGLRKTIGVMPAYHFAVVENEAPYAVSVFECSDESHEIAVKEIESALKLWTRCMATGNWPAYSTELQWINPPGWTSYRSEATLARHEMREAAE